MRAKILSHAKFRVLGVMEGDACPAEEFLLEGEVATKASRLGLIAMCCYIAENGLQHCPAGWWHEADKAKGIYALIKGQLRLLFFKGENGDIAICTTGHRKKGQKADASAVALAHAWRQRYVHAIRHRLYEVVEDEDQSSA